MVNNEVATRFSTADCGVRARFAAAQNFALLAVHASRSVDELWRNPRRRRAAHYTDRILKGANPAEMPIEQPMRFDFIVNLKTARELGITLPPAIMIQATEFIE